MLVPTDDTPCERVFVVSGLGPGRELRVVPSDPRLLVDVESKQNGATVTVTVPSDSTFTGASVIIGSTQEPDKHRVDVIVS
jgi:hypothetical protein